MKVATRNQGRSKMTLSDQEYIECLNKEVKGLCEWVTSRGKTIHKLEKQIRRMRKKIRNLRQNLKDKT
jgi:peptidoglycan hydrolase CwlO-like protein